MIRLAKCYNFLTKKRFSLLHLLLETLQFLVTEIKSSTHNTTENQLPHLSSEKIYPNPKTN
jgi:hypothetical protein